MWGTFTVSQLNHTGCSHKVEKHGKGVLAAGNSLPLLVEVVVDPPVGYGHHHDEDPEQHHAHHELVHHPHGHRRRLQVAARKEVRLYPLDSQYCD